MVSLKSTSVGFWRKLCGSKSKPCPVLPLLCPLPPAPSYMMVPGRCGQRIQHGGLGLSSPMVSQPQRLCPALSSGLRTHCPSLAQQLLFSWFPYSDIRSTLLFFRHPQCRHAHQAALWLLPYPVATLLLPSVTWGPLNIWFLLHMQCFVPTLTYTVIKWAEK